MKTVKLSETVFALTERYPELVDVLKDLGLAGVANPLVRNTVGRTMVLKEGAKKMGIPLKQVIDALQSEGFTIEDE